MSVDWKVTGLSMAAVLALVIIHGRNLPPGGYDLVKDLLTPAAAKPLEKFGVVTDENFQEVSEAYSRTVYPYMTGFGPAYGASWGIGYLADKENK